MDAGKREGDTLNQIINGETTAVSMSTGDRLASLQERWATHSADAGASDAVYATLREAIILGKLRPGDGLIEEHVARQFGVSRTPVREALQRLRAEGLAKPIGRRGLVVRTISEQEMSEVYTVRAMLDGLAARLAATQALPSEVVHLRWLNQGIDAAYRQGDSARMSALSLEFHAALAQMARNGLVTQFNEQILDRVRRFSQNLFGSSDRSGVMIEEHEQLIAALEAHDPDEAERVARAHVSRAHHLRIDILHDATEPTNGKENLTPQP